MVDKTDQALLDILQNDFPLSARPFQDMAGQLGISEEEVLLRTRRLKTEGLIRRIGGVMDSKSLGYTSTLCAASVPAERMDEVAAIISQNPGVTHNYLREHVYNIWFTLTCQSPQEQQKQIAGLEADTGCRIQSMPTRKLYKIKVSFDMEEANEIE